MGGGGDLQAEPDGPHGGVEGGGASHYDKVYTADRPEIFFKATPHRVSGPAQPVRVRHDSRWSVPEPEFTLVIDPAGRIVGYTIGNDMSAADIEGRTRSYLPQAKVYSQCCGLGPAIQLADEPLNLAETTVGLVIGRGGRTLTRARRRWLSFTVSCRNWRRGCTGRTSFRLGAFLLTGTGIIPPDDFTLENGDSVSITISGIGTLTNPVVKNSL